MTANLNSDLRRAILDLVYKGRDGHIPSAFSIVDLVDHLYGEVLRVDPRAPQWPGRDYFILSKGHGCVALYAVLRKYGFLNDRDLEGFCREGGLLGEHPDCRKVPGVEASTGSLGHGMPLAVGIALGLRIQGADNRVVTLVGDGECQEGTIWESANIAANLRLGQLCAVVDWNGSAAQLMPLDDLPAKWAAFGWRVRVIDGHSHEEIRSAFASWCPAPTAQPQVIVARTVKGKGVPLLEGHGQWHHRIPSAEEYRAITEVLSRP
ncbi:MAG: 1-deoxy-D-xylulose-5-phosphate synthase [Candidatus Omnitrophica bacterium]|nr:1-deoxy-D-xylulose-5-phosphate synthase [Candidatus Omnitrophota bacterium]